MLDLRYSLTIEATEDPKFFSFYSEEIQGFTGTVKSVDDCLKRASQGMRDHVALLKELGLPVPESNPDPQVLIHNANESRAA
jgi:predicted RNase H-like HicB family nuclease